MPHLYTRDVAIAAVICFFGGVGLTLLVVLICYQVFRRKKLKESKRQKEEEEAGSTVANHHVRHLDVSENRRDVFLQASSSKPWDRETMLLDTRFENHNGQICSKVDEDSSHFRCPDCCTKGKIGVGPNPMRWNKELEAEEERENMGMRMVSEEERGKAGNLQGILSRNIPNKLFSFANSKSSSHQQRETFSERVETLPTYETGRDTHSYRINVEGKGTGYEILHCESCHRNYRPPQQTIRPGRIDTNMRDAAVFDGFHTQHKLIDKGRNHNQFDMMKNTESRRQLRNVTFDLESLRTPEQEKIQGKDKWEEGARISTDKEKDGEKRHKTKIQSSRILKVKLNLNPLRKSKVHPKRKHEQNHSEKSSSKKSNEKRQHGKYQQQSKVRSGKKTKGSGEKLKKSTKSKGSSGNGVEENEEEDRGKSKATEQDGQEDMTGNQGENTGPDNSQSSDPTSTAHQSASAAATGQVQNSQSGPVQYQGSGLALGSGEIPFKNPFSLSAAERYHTTSLPLLGSTGSQLTSSSVSLQGGNLLLSTMAPAFNSLLSSGPANSIVPSVAISGPNLASSSSLGSFSRQTGVGLISPATSLLANTVHANPLQAGAIQTAPPHNSQAGALALNLATNPAVNPEPIQFLSRSLLPDRAPLVGRLESDPAKRPELQTSNELHQLPSESQAPQSIESLPVQAQAPPDGLSGVTSQAQGSGTVVENMSNNSQTETERVPGASAVSMLAGGAASAEGPAVGVSRDHMEAADMSISVVSRSSADDSVVLLHQEYLSEEGDSSPRRKLRLALPEKTSSREPTALEKKIR